MAGTIVRAEIPTDEFVLSQTLQTLESVTIDIRNVIAGIQEGLMPLVWVGSTDRDAIETALDSDDSLDDFSFIVELNQNCLYQVTWNEQVETRIQTIVEQSMVLNATGNDETWCLQLLFTDRDDISKTFDNCQKQGMEFEIQKIQELTTGEKGQFDLTENQQETLKRAHERGYYSIPREATADDLAAELGISHQAVSERLRRGHGSLVENTLVRNGSPEQFREDPTEE